MSNCKLNFESMLFNYETTNKTDFRAGDLKPLKVTAFQKKSTCYRMRPPGLKDVHALTDWRVPNVPFDLYIRPKETVHGDPRAVQKPFVVSPNEERKKVQQTRTRLVMTPAISLDDIGEGGRDLLIHDVYTTEAQRASRDIAEMAKLPTVRAPFPGPPATANPITLPNVKSPYVYPEWRMESLKWDRNALRSYTDPTKEFWFQHSPSLCKACDETFSREAMKKLRKRH